MTKSAADSRTAFTATALSVAVVGTLSRSRKRKPSYSARNQRSPARPPSLNTEADRMCPVPGASVTPQAP